MQKFKSNNEGYRIHNAREVITQYGGHSDQPKTPESEESEVEWRPANFNMMKNLLMNEEALLSVMPNSPPISPIYMDLVDNS